MSTKINDIRFLNGTSLKQYYANSRNTIEDPLFTGFTFAIDTEHSPLFFALAGKEYYESLRSESGTSTELSQLIETKLSDMYKYHIYGAPDTYEMNTISTKDLLNDRRAGYGLQDRYYMENVLYGAADYIYMVDKVTKGTYIDEFGVMDIGNGTPTSSYYESAKETLGELEQQKWQEKENEINELLSPTIDENGEFVSPDLGNIEIDITDELENITPEEKLANAVNRAQAAITPEMEQAHQQNEEDLNNAKEELEAAKSGEYKTATEKLKQLQKEADDQKQKIWEKLDEYKTTMQTQAAKLRGGQGQAECKETINKTYSAYEKFMNYFESKKTDTTDENGKKYSEIYNHISFSISSPNENEVKKEIDKLQGISDEDKEYFGKAYKVILTTASSQPIWNADFDKEITSLQSEISKFEKTLYGVHPNGTIGTPQNPAPGSKGYAVKEAENKLNNDEYTKSTQRYNEVKDIQDNWEDIQEYQSQNASKVTLTRSFELPSADVTDESRNTREIYEVPQTVYDMMGFITGMEDLTMKYPYMLQTVSGLDEAYKKYFEVKDPYMGSGDDKISIDCLEFLDMRLSSMFNKYFNAVYDRQYRRERVPINLRRFQCSIYVHDIRNFKDTLNTKEFANSDLSKMVEMALNYLSVIEFKFYDCEIVPEETGSIFDNVTNLPNNDMRNTKFTFRYGNCVINFLPFDDLRRYLLDNKPVEDIKKPEKQYINKNGEEKLYKPYTDENFEEDKKIVLSSGMRRASDGDNDGIISTIETIEDIEQRVKYNKARDVDDGNFRRWFDKSELGNVNNNDYRDYVRHDSSVAVDDFYKTSIVNNFALNSVVNKNKELTAMDDALRRIIVGISASTGIPPEGVPDALNIKFIEPIINDKVKTGNVIKDLGNATNSKIVDTETTEYIGKVVGNESGEKTVNDLGNVNDKK